MVVVFILKDIGFTKSKLINIREKCHCSGIFLCVPIYYSLYKERKEGNVLFNNGCNTFYLRLYAINHRIGQNV